MYIGLHVKYQFCLLDFNETWNFTTDFRKTQMSNFMKIRPVGAELLHADGQIDRRRDRHVEANSRFSQFCESVFGVFGRKVAKIRLLISTSLLRIQQLDSYWQERVEGKICTGTDKYFNSVQKSLYSEHFVWRLHTF
jgi:hypothetical protein